MSIGKDSIQKRVAKTTEAAETVVENAPKAVETKPAAAKKPAAKKTGTTAAKTVAKTPAKKPATPKPAVGTAVMANVSPEVVEKVTGHKENSAVKHVQIGGKLPTHLL